MVPRPKSDLECKSPDLANVGMKEINNLDFKALRYRAANEDKRSFLGQQHWKMTH